MSAAITPDTADELYRAAQYHARWLCDHGWTCIAPVDQNAPVPEPVAGQVWRSPRIRTETRTVVGVDDLDKLTYSTPRYANLMISREGWDKWVRKSGARPESGAEWQHQTPPDGDATGEVL